MTMHWQSKLILLLVLPVAGADLVLQTHFWLAEEPRVATWTLGICTLFGLIVWRLHAGTDSAALTGSCIAASLMFSTTFFPYSPMHTALLPLLCVFLLAFISTRLGSEVKQRLGTGEAGPAGRLSPQVAANLGVAMLVALPFVQGRLIDSNLFGSSKFGSSGQASMLLFAPILAALAEAAADTVSSEIGQVFGGRPRLITTLRTVEPGTDGAISFTGTLTGIAAAAIIASAGSWALRGDFELGAVSTAGAVFGLLFDSLLGATLERRGWLKNDAVNFLSTLSAAGFALLMLAVIPTHG